jgi:hypothetical protein
MFEKIKRFALTRHQAAPMARERELFLAWLHRGGNGIGNLRIAAGYLLQIVRFLRLKAPRNVAHDIGCHENVTIIAANLEQLRTKGE